MESDTIVATILIVSAAAYLVLGAVLFLARRKPGGCTIGLLYGVVATWVAGGAIEVLATSAQVFTIGRTGHFVGTAFLPLLVFIGFREFTGKDNPRWLIVLLAIVPCVSVVLAATNFSHGLMWGLSGASGAGVFPSRPDGWGPWFLYVHAPYSYLLVSAALLSVIAHRFAVPPAYRQSLAGLIAMSTLPLVATVAFDFGLTPESVPLVPLVFAALLPANLWLAFRAKLIGYAPMAYETVFQNMADPVVVLDAQNRIVSLNRCAEMMLGLAERDALHVPLQDVFGAGSTGVFEALDTAKPTRLLTESGRYLHVQASPVEQDGRATRGGHVLMFRDVSDVELAQAEIRKNELLLRTLVDHSVNGIVRLRWARDGAGDLAELVCIFANAAAARFLDMPVERLIDRDAASVLGLAGSGLNDAELRAVLEDFAHAVTSRTGLDTEVRQGSGSSARWLRMISEPVGEDIAVTFIDVTDSKEKQTQMESMASSDPLTGVLNRRGFEREASERLKESADDAIGALLFIDLNDFKHINDRYGHAVGDQLLTIAAKRLQKSLRSCDVIGRPGGDEFVALVPDVSRYLAGKLAARLAVSLEEPYVIGEQRLECSASIGLAHYPDNANTLTGLLREADEAMYRAKARNRDAGELGLVSRLEKAI